MVRRSPWIWLGLALGLLVTAVIMRACRSAPSSPAEAAAPSPAVVPSEPIEVLLAGCAASMRVPATCQVARDRAPLQLWVAGLEAPRVRIDGTPVTPTTAVQTDDPGWRLRVSVPAGAQTLTVVGPDEHEGFRVALTPAVVTPRVQAVLDALPLDSAADREGAYRQAAAALRAMVELPPDESIAARRLQGRLLRQLGQPEEATRAVQAGFDLAMAHGRHAAAVELGLLLSVTRSDRGDEKGARWALDAVRVALPTVLDAEAQAQWSLTAGGQARAEQDHGAALRHHARAQRIARRLGLVDVELSAATQRVDVLGLLGRGREQREIIERMFELMEPLPQLECKHALYLNGAGWSLLLSSRPGESTEMARRLLSRAERIHGPDGGCEVGHHPEWGDNLATLRLNLALEALHRGDPADVQAQLDALEHVSPGLVPWVGYVQARLAQVRGQVADALAHVRRVEADPSIGMDPLLPWQTAVLHGDLERDQQAPDAALEAYLVAERRLDDLVRTVGIDQGREGLLAGVHTSAAQAIDLLLQRGQPRRAATRARVSRARALRPMGRAGVLARLPPAQRETWQREREHYRRLARRLEAELVDAWSLPRDARQRMQREHAGVREQMRGHLDRAYRALSQATAPAELVLPSAQPGHAWLLTHPLPQGWAVFMITATEVVAHRVLTLPAPDDREAQAAALLEPFASVLESAEVLHVLSMGAWVDVPVHALPFDGDVLLAALPVVYKLDLGAPTPTPAPTRRGLVVADPATRRADLGRLPAAQQEGRDVASALRAEGWEVATLEAEHATHEAVSEAVAQVDLLHYAGHGERGGVEGWDSALPLAGEASLDVRDVLALPHSPATVVLSGCETGLADGELSSGGMHLAGAFLVAGSTHVVAAADEVPDALASALGQALYAADGLTLNDAARLRRALLALRDRPEPWASRWAVYRGFVP